MKQFLKKLINHPTWFCLTCLTLGSLTGLLNGLSSRPSAPRPATPERVWRYIAQEAPKRGIDPQFVYAIAWAESSLNPRASSGYANGMMQLSEIAWDEVSNTSYQLAWNWHTNVYVAIDYLAFCKNFLEQNGHFSYPLLAACYRYGPYKVKAANYSLSQLPAPSNRIYQQLFAGNTAPVKTP
ncbi:lytic transglycosylase domain-containing protein [Ruficoccus amylovorans]|uniref:Lytic transglycosylase domain-containing protein n=1 Tax=Ruficoccus amylovorans TaxID=1804625 RepID=A0A842HA47_9BACT|nr:lytic transglycosylase domain-containing protein [Ruficoccus amylovorans]MBC2593282.1 lytic transglycosylase domain-containing protein [Ruficoccus amylovorans]